MSIALGVDGAAHDLDSTRPEQGFESILRTHHIGHELGIHIGMGSELAHLPCVFVQRAYGAKPKAVRQMKRIALVVLRTSIAFGRMRDHQLADMPFEHFVQPNACYQVTGSTGGRHLPAIPMLH